MGILPLKPTIISSSIAPATAISIASAAVNSSRQFSPINQVPTIVTLAQIPKGAAISKPPNSSILPVSTNSPGTASSLTTVNFNTIQPNTVIKTKVRH